MYECEAERSFLRETEGGCQVPIGVCTEVKEGQIHLKGIVLSIDGTKAVKGEISGPVADAKTIGRQLALNMKKEGADVILQEVFEATAKGLVVKEDD
jgi:hydroxymethylbilane synthase